MIICTGFPTFCEVKCDIFVKKSINKRFKQPWIEMLVSFMYLLTVNEQPKYGINPFITSRIESLVCQHCPYQQEVTILAMPLSDKS